MLLQNRITLGKLQMERFGEHIILGHIDLAHGIHDNKKNQEQRNQIRVGDQPAFVVLGGASLFPPIAPSQCRHLPP
ncbi:hypothetical protein D3C75_1184100 [compost metagenome]